MVSNEYGGGSNWYVSKLSSEIGTLNGLSSSFCRGKHVSLCSLEANQGRVLTVGMSSTLET